MVLKVGYKLVTDADMNMKRNEKEFTQRRGDGLFFDRSLSK